MCRCAGHDKDFAKWTGFFPGSAESNLLGIDLNAFHRQGYAKIFFVKKGIPARKTKVICPSLRAFHIQAVERGLATL